MKTFFTFLLSTMAIAAVLSWAFGHTIPGQAFGEALTMGALFGSILGGLAFAVEKM